MNELWLARHGETEWTLSRQHTSVTDIDLTPYGEEQARALGERLTGHSFAAVLTSPLARARRTAELAGYGSDAEPVDDLVEYRYGNYEARTTADIREERPGWDLWEDGCPGGETTAEVASRLDRVLERARNAGGPLLLFGHGHATRVLAARFLELDGKAGRLLALDPASLSVLGSEHDRPAVRRWNDTCHLERLG